MVLKKFMGGWDGCRTRKVDKSETQTLCRPGGKPKRDFKPV